MTVLTSITIIFLIAFLLNFLWEVWHAQLYETCRTMPLPELTRLLTWQSIKDSFWITVAYLVAPTVLSFLVLLLIFSYAVERYALRHHWWQYAPAMPRVFGVGLSPLLELAVTGFIALQLTLCIEMFLMP